MRHKGKNVLITGAGSGIGRAMAVLFAQEGARVAINGRREDRLQETRKQVEAIGGTALVLPYDVADYDAVQAATRTAIGEFGQLHVLCANAGVAPTVNFVDMSPEEWDRMIKVHLYGMYNSCKAVVGHMIDHGWGRIVITASMAAFSGDAHLSHYSAAKAGQVAFAKSLARETAPTGVTVNCIAPGLTQTDILAEVDPEIIAKYTPPVGRIGTPEDQAHAASYLASDEASFVTGHTIKVNGGAF